MYPILRSDVLLSKSDPDPYTSSVSYYAINHSGDRYRITPTLYKALLHADGTHPLFPEEDDDKELLLKLEQFELILTSRFVPINFFLKRFILFPVGSTARPLRPLCRVLNFFLPWAAVCVFVLSLFRLRTAFLISDITFHLVPYLVLLLLSISIHELGHAIAGIAYRYTIIDVGILLAVFLPIGAYVSHYDNRRATPHQKFQFAMAGIEANLLMAGICICAASHLPRAALTLITAAVLNLMFLFTNLLPCDELDGEVALSALLQVENISFYAKKFLRSKRYRHHVLHSGSVGVLILLLFIFIYLSTIFVFVLNLAAIFVLLH